MGVGAALDCGVAGSALPMTLRASACWMLCLSAAVLAWSCGQRTDSKSGNGADAQVTTLGKFEVTARLVEVPDGAVFKRDLYDYATVLKYEVVKVHRGQLNSRTIYVGHYNPWKPRAEAADARVKNTGGNLQRFRAGELHHMALDAPIEDCFMGGLVNKYFGQDTGPIYWALWTNPGP